MLSQNFKVIAFEIKIFTIIKTNFKLEEYDDSMPKDMLNDTSLLELERY